MRDSLEERKQLERELLNQLKARRSSLQAMLQEVDSHWDRGDLFYHFYHQSLKVYALQDDTTAIVTMLRELLPERELNADFLRIVAEGIDKEFALEHNSRWHEETRPILEAFFHARMMLQLALKYSEKLEKPPSILPSGWGAVLYLYQLR